MKISKVNHVKTGISEKPIDAGGIMYAYPNGYENEIDIRNHINKLTNKTQNLYNLFTPINVPPKKFSIYSECTKILNSYFRKMVICKLDRSTDEMIYSEMINTKYSAPEINEEGKKRNVNFKEVNTTVGRCLRNSLRKNVTVDNETISLSCIIIKISDAVLVDNKYNEKMHSIPREEILAFIYKVRADYTKSEYIEKIAQSIEKQNVQVQISEDKTKFVLSSYYNKKKKYIFDFIKEYASKNDDERSAMLKHIRFLIVLYIYGEDIANRSLDDSSFCAWNYGRTIELHEKESFSNEIENIISEIKDIPSSQKSKLRVNGDKLKNKIGNAVAIHYNSANKYSELNDSDKSWITYISDSVAGILKSAKYVKNDEVYKLNCGYLCKVIWDEFVSFIAMKYIEMGKAVYHFSMKDNLKDVSKGIECSIGDVDERFKQGISSFDYERISAEDKFSRRLTEYVTFAVNNFDRSIRNPEERLKIKGRNDFSDLLVLNYKDIAIRPDAKKRILRFFGGASIYKDTEMDTMPEQTMIEEIKQYLFQVRNENYHFVSGEVKDISTIFSDVIWKSEHDRLGRIIKKKYYSNNVPLFYGKEDINTLMNCLYKESNNDVYQIPSFNKVISRKEIKQIIDRLIPKRNRLFINDIETADIYENTIYFIFKEIYYHKFINNEDINNRFIYAIKGLKASNKTEENAHNDFIERVKVLLKEKNSFGELCQEIMTEYNQQNNQKSKRPSAIEKIEEGKRQIINLENKNEVYKHYVMLLYLGIREAFVKYISENEIYSFLMNPKKKEQPKEENFINGWTPKMYNSLVLNDSFTRSWYITAHFLNQRQLNHLIGAIKEHITLLISIDNRSRYTNNKSYDEENDIRKYSKLIDVFEFVKYYCGVVSNNIEDYFVNNDDYARYISRFINFGGKDAKSLRVFCNKKYNGNMFGKFYDDKNPILDRNIILSSIYGNEKILSGIIKKVEINELINHFGNKKLISSIVGNDVTEKNDLLKLRAYQNEKNRIELVDVLSITELTNTLLSDLISCSYLRERDLMYMQLGFYYVKLYHTDSLLKDSNLRKLNGNDMCNISDGAILYQIASMYSYSLPLYRTDENDTVIGKSVGQIGGKLKGFIIDYCKESFDNASIYNCGLELFEDLKKHDNYIKLRDYLDHLKYFARQDKSILDLYSEINDGFFSYSTKLKKRSSYMLPNILLSDFVNAKFSFDCIKNKKKTAISLKEIKTDYLTYKEMKSIMTDDKDERNENDLDLNKEDKNNKRKHNNKGFKVPARSAYYLDTVRRLLSYRNN